MAMTFKEQIAADNKAVFLNLFEFSDTHNVNGKDMACQVDSNEMIDREKRYQYKRSLYADGVFLKELLIYVRADDFGGLPAVGRILTFDGKYYTVSDAIDEDGIYYISLQANKSSNH